MGALIACLDGEVQRLEQEILRQLKPLRLDGDRERVATDLGPPLPGRGFSVERPLEETPDVVVAGLLELGVRAPRSVRLRVGGDARRRSADLPVHAVPGRGGPGRLEYELIDSLDECIRNATQCSVDVTLGATCCASGADWCSPCRRDHTSGRSSPASPPRSRGACRSSRRTDGGELGGRACGSRFADLPDHVA